ncbi:Predicted E3 ubiquitin ligase involved in peroxisome organization [Plasmopara halstedii]|uniref:Peroxin-12 n=1 Tax=Plasmopara halstedii TaxID=4781 RepID=A0A0P1B801_PLAHL|nr:Predicted E3 ubiquitin ligase involved in peroxisome organization [Plasmopara halstedii]CEG50520.1 Predicted E3 ubiquitin ligase involved in peroxisome organization [Plasmopara halstedii]|eukprot:XP_024586889.1 Predicted E3 ubiquitin ligase involved in peroxisome organization [Plasmopara halstedii]
MLFLEQTKGFAQEDASTAPSLFELLMHERMASSIKPAADYLIHVLCESYPNLSLTLPVRHFDESYTLLRLCIERYFLSKYDSLFTEKIHGMKRIRLKKANRDAESTTEPLTPQAKNQALLLNVVVPYLKTKLDSCYRKTAEQLRTTQMSNMNQREQQLGNFLRRLRSFQWLNLLKKGFVVTYPFAHFAYEGTFFLYQWFYLFGDTPYFSPLLRLMKTVLLKVTSDDESALCQNEATYRTNLMNKLAGPNIFARLQRLVHRATWVMLDYSHMLLLLGVAAYKLVEWVYLDEDLAAKLRHNRSDAPIPPPPLPPKVPEESLALATVDATRCPLCKKKRVNPAMTSSGFVFCYPCIYRYVEQHGQCPITQIKCEASTIIKIYDDARDPYASSTSVHDYEN